MSLSREEFWVLDVAAQINCPVIIPYLNTPEADEIYNKSRHHGLSASELADLFVVMQRQGDIIVFPYRTDLFPESKVLKPEPIKPFGSRTVRDFTGIWNRATFFSKTEILKYLAAGEQLSQRHDEYPVSAQEWFDAMLLLCLTPQGAEKWEQTAQVDWNKFLDCRGEWQEWKDNDLSEQQSLMIWRAAALHKETLAAYFDWKIRWDNHPDSEYLHSFKRYHTERISPWRATYWKTFPEGFECDYLELSTPQRMHGRRVTLSKNHHEFHESSWAEHHTLFDWCNSYVRDFPFEGD